MEGDSIVIPLNFWVKGNYSPTIDIERKGVIRVLMGNNYGITMDSINIYVFSIYVV